MQEADSTSVGGRSFFKYDNCPHWEWVALSLLGGLTEAGCPTLKALPVVEDKAL